MKTNQLLIQGAKLLCILVFAIFLGGKFGKAREDSKLLVRMDMAVVSPTTVEQPTVGNELVTSLLNALNVQQSQFVLANSSLKREALRQRIEKMKDKKTTVENRRQSPEIAVNVDSRPPRGDDLIENTS